MGGDYYQWYKSHGICTNCHKESTEHGKSLCWRCRVQKNEKARERRTKMSEDKKQARAEYSKAYNYRIYHERKAAGICIACGKRKADKYVRCEICEKRMNYRRRQKISYIEAHQPYLHGRG